jgi:hypothetical protein
MNKKDIYKIIDEERNAIEKDDNYLGQFIHTLLNLIKKRIQSEIK